MEKIRKVCGMLSIKNFLLLTVAGIVNAFGVVIFLAPVKLYDSGISGTAMLVSQLTPKWISLSLVLILLNIPIFLLGLKREGVVFTIYAIYAVLIYSIVAWIITDILPVDVTIVSPLAGSDLFLWRYYLRLRKRTCGTVWRRDGWYRYHRRYVREEAWVKSRFVRNGIQCNLIYHMWNCA